MFCDVEKCCCLVVTTVTYQQTTNLFFVLKQNIEACHTNPLLVEHGFGSKNVN